MTKKQKTQSVSLDELGSTDRRPRNEKVSNEMFWLLVVITFLGVVSIWFVFFKQNLVKVKSVPGTDFAAFRKDFDQSFKKLGASLQNRPKEQVAPTEALRNNILAELEKKRTLNQATTTLESSVLGNSTAPLSLGNWKEFKSQYGFSLQYPGEWQVEEKKVAEWFNFSLSQKGVDDGILISNLPLDFTFGVLSESGVSVDGEKYKKIILDVPTKSALIAIEKDKYKGYYIIYPTINLENTQLFESIIETLKFSE